MKKIKQALILNNYPLQFIEKHTENYRLIQNHNQQNSNTTLDNRFDYYECIFLPHIQHFTKDLSHFLIKKCNLTHIAGWAENGAISNEVHSRACYSYG